MCFLFIGHPHQILHAAPIAAAMAQAGQVEVHVAASTGRHLAMIRSYLDDLGAGAVTFHRLWPSRLEPRSEASVPPKLLVLAAALPLLAGFDAIITPERTSLTLKKLGLTRPLFIHTDHGAGDRAVGYEKRIADFDFTLVAGGKQAARMADEGLIRDAGHAVVGYPKFDLVDAMRRPAPIRFGEARPVVLYNPHFRRKLGSWDAFGEAVLDQFADSGEYNLIFAPHLRLFEGASRRQLARLERYRRRPNIHIDLGSQRSCDMSYTNAADLYLGDVSSQVYEFIRRPRPCLFLDANGVDWRGDRNYLHWRFGPVLDTPDDLIARLDDARGSHQAFRPQQEAGFAQTFDLKGRSSDRAAAAILGFLASQPMRPRTACTRRPAYAGAAGFPAPAE